MANLLVSAHLLNIRMNLSHGSAQGGKSREGKENRALRGVLTQGILGYPKGSSREKFFFLISKVSNSIP